MTQAISENRKKFCKASTDLITNLLPNLIEQILESLPLRDAARTSVLSRDWRYKWLSLRNITLGLKFCETFRKRENAATLGFPQLYSDTVNKILLRHVGPIHKFIFHVPSDLPKACDINCWIEFVCRNSVKIFHLVDHRLLNPKLPSCIFSCVSLTHLTLNCGPLSFPPKFAGFPCLIGLSLCTCEDNNQKLESLIHNCPQLERLLFVLLKAINCLTIRVSKLEELVLHATVHNLCLEETARVKRLKLDMKGVDLPRGGMIELLSSLPNIEKLQLFNFQGCGLKPPKSLAKRLDKLHTLSLGMPLTCQYTISLICCLFESCSNLSRLQIKASRCGN